MLQQLLHGCDINCLVNSLQVCDHHACQWASLLDTQRPKSPCPPISSSPTPPPLVQTAPCLPCPHQGDVFLLLRGGHRPPGCAGLRRLGRLLLLRLLQFPPPPIPAVHILDAGSVSSERHSERSNAETASPPHCLPPGLPQPPRHPSRGLTPLHPASVVLTTLPKPHQVEDVGSRGAEPLLPGPLPALQLHPHGVQQPLPVGYLMGPHDVEEGRAQGVQRLALVGDLWAEGSVKGGHSVSKWATDLQRKRGRS